MEGAGHGLYGPLGVIAAPASFFQSIAFAWFGCPLVVMLCTFASATRGFPFVPCAYYASGLIGGFLPEYRDWRLLDSPEYSALLTVTAALYLIWQIFLWRNWFLLFPSSE